MIVRIEGYVTTNFQMFVEVDDLDEVLQKTRSMVHCKWNPELLNHPTQQDISIITKQEIVDENPYVELIKNEVEKRRKLSSKFGESEMHNIKHDLSREMTEEIMEKYRHLLYEVQE